MSRQVNATEVLSQPITIGSLTIKNRMVQGPMAVLSPQEDGRPSDQTIAYLETRAKGGVGLIIAGPGVQEQRSVDETPYTPIPRAFEEDSLPDLKRMADAVHAHGVPIFAEVMPGFGRMGVPRTGPTIAASPVQLVIPESAMPGGLKVPGGRAMPTPQEATIEQIQDLERSVAASALLLRRAGWDGIDLAAHMSYFAASFLTPRTNKRTDQYGGGVENRARLLVNIVRHIRAEAGRDFPIGLRITCNERLEGGQGPDEYAAIAQVVEREGLDYVALSVGCYESMKVGLNSKEGSVFKHGEAEAFRKALKCPILLPGLHDPQAAAEAIAGGFGDMTMLARPMLADPEYPRKVMEGRIGDIVRCNEDNYCIRRLMLNLPMRCTVNPELGVESRKGGPPPLRRFLEVPKEKMMMSVATSRAAMTLATRLMKQGH